MPRKTPAPKKLALSPGAFRGIVLSNTDGDTLSVLVDTGLEKLLGSKQFFDLDVRLLGVDTPETSSKDPGLRVLAKKAKARVAELCPAGSAVVLASLGKDKYGRTDATVTLADGRSLADILLEEGLAKPYDGTGPKPWQVEGRKMGFKKDRKGHKAGKPLFAAAPAPEKIDKRSDLRALMPPVYDQLSTSSCCGQACNAAIDYLMRVSPGGDDRPSSSLFLYYNARKLDNNVSVDEGTYLTQIVKSAETFGAAAETLLPFSEEAVFKAPSKAAYADGLKHQVVQARALRNLDEIRARLTAGYPVIFGLMLYDSFMLPLVARTGQVPVPHTKTEALVGGHAMCIVGHDDDKQLFTLRNSWNTSWGDSGHGYVPYEYVREHGSDFWSLLGVEEV